MEIPGKVDRLLDLKSVQGRVNFSASTIYRWVSERRFPAPRKAGAHNRWLESEVDDWMRSIPVVKE